MFFYSSSKQESLDLQNWLNFLLLVVRSWRVIPSFIWLVFFTCCTTCALTWFTDIFYRPAEEEESEISCTACSTCATLLPTRFIFYIILHGGVWSFCNLYAIPYHFPVLQLFLLAGFVVNIFCCNISTYLYILG
jgi:hypothetical protein